MPKRGFIIHIFINDNNFSGTWYKDQPFVLATQVQQVFYVIDIKSGKDWRVIERMQPWNLYNIQLPTNILHLVFFILIFSLNFLIHHPSFPVFKPSKIIWEALSVSKIQVFVWSLARGRLLTILSGYQLVEGYLLCLIW